MGGRECTPDLVFNFCAESNFCSFILLRDLLSQVSCFCVFSCHSDLPGSTSKAAAGYENFLKFVLNIEVSLIQNLAIDE